MRLACPDSRKTKPESPEPPRNCRGTVDTGPYGRLKAVRHPEWLGNALWRTLHAFVPSLARPDDLFARGLLPDAEYRLYLQLDPRDRLHALAVTRKLLALYPDATPELCRAALLHDVGKAGASYRPAERILAGLYAPVVPAAPRFRGLRGAWQLKRHHPAYGARLIVDAGGAARVADIVSRHHDPQGDADAARLRRADARF